MRAAFPKGLLFLSALSCGAPSIAQEFSVNIAQAAAAIAVPMSSPQDIIAAQKAMTLEAVAAMHARLAEIVPMQPRNDAIAQSAADFSAHWGAVVSQYTDTQTQLVDSLIIGVTVQHQTQISDFMTADRLVPELSLFADPMFTNPLEIPISFSIPPLIDAGFFGL
jgi:hypothetical protein